MNDFDNWSLFYISRKYVEPGFSISSMMIRMLLWHISCECKNVHLFRKRCMHQINAVVNHGSSTLEPRRFILHCLTGISLLATLRLLCQLSLNPPFDYTRHSSAFSAKPPPSPKAGTGLRLIPQHRPACTT